jgi:hypothetical protein
VECALREGVIFHQHAVLVHFLEIWKSCSHPHHQHHIQADASHTDTFFVITMRMKMMLATTKKILVLSLLLVVTSSFVTDAFVTTSRGGVVMRQQANFATVRGVQPQQRRMQIDQEDEEMEMQKNDSNDSDNKSNNKRVSASFISRREILAAGIAVSVTAQTIGTAQPVNAATSTSDSVYKPAKRPTAYRVDSSTPPTLLPLDNSKERNVLTDLGKGSGTNKAEILKDTVNLNNILQKAVYGSITAVTTFADPEDESKSGPGYATFVCFGVPKETTAVDMELVQGLLTTILKPRKAKKAATALGFASLPLSTQTALDAYTTTVSAATTDNDNTLVQALMDAGVSEETVQLHLPLLQYAKSKSLDLLAMAPEVQDVTAVRAKGLQNVDPARRDRYVIDAQGFIALSQDPAFKLYIDRSLLKDYDEANNINNGGKAGDTTGDGRGNFFAERILVHETAATVAAQYAVTRPESMVAVVAPTPDVRYLRGINGRIARICKALNPDANKVTNDCVTTILLNPTAKETLSKSRFLRLEIGTGPRTLDYQTKVADYLWFSSMPKVNLITRLME